MNKMTVTAINLATCAQNGREGVAKMLAAEGQWVEGALETARLKAEAVARKAEALDRDLRQGGDKAVRLYQIVHDKMIAAQMELEAWHAALMVAGLQICNSANSGEFVLSGFSRIMHDEWTKAQTVWF